jgi:hypothetical protein
MNWLDAALSEDLGGGQADASTREASTRIYEK